MWEISSSTRDRTCVPCIARQILNHWTTREIPDYYLYHLLDFCVQLGIFQDFVFLEIPMVPSEFSLNIYVSEAVMFQGLQHRGMFRPPTPFERGYGLVISLLVFSEFSKISWHQPKIVLVFKKNLKVLSVFKQQTLAWIFITHLPAPKNTAIGILLFLHVPSIKDVSESCR